MILQVPPAPPPARPAITIYATGAVGGVRMKVVCRAGCTITGALTVDSPTARKLHIGSSRIAGTIKRVVDPGTFRLTVPLSLKAKQHFRSSGLSAIKARLSASALYPDTGISGSKSRTVTITRSS